MNIKCFFVSAVVALGAAVSLVNCSGGDREAEEAFISLSEFKTGMKSFYCDQGFRSFAVVPEGNVVNDQSPSHSTPNIKEEEDEDGNVTQIVSNVVGTVTVEGYLQALTEGAQKFPCLLTYTLYENKTAKVGIICTYGDELDDNILIKAMGLNGVGDLDSLKIDVYLDFNPGGMMQVKVSGHADIAADDEKADEEDADNEGADIDEEFTVPFSVHRKGTGNRILD